MPDSKGSALVKTVETLATQKEKLVTKEKELVETLNAALTRMGYRVVPATGIARVRRRGRPPGSRSARRTRMSKAGQPRKRGRRAMSAAERKAVSRRMKAYWAKRRKPGRRRSLAGKKSG